jgi:hypothetical protein
MRLRLITLLLCFLAAGTSLGQRASQSSSAPPPPPQLPQQGVEPEERPPTPMEKRLQIERNKQRQEEIKRDADKLLQLATELKLSVDRSNANVLSLDVVKKATEIEKLAKAVKEKMKAY